MHPVSNVTLYLLPSGAEKAETGAGDEERGEGRVEGGHREPSIPGTDLTIAVYRQHLKSKSCLNNALLSLRL